MVYSLCKSNTVLDLLWVFVCVSEREVRKFGI